MTFNWQGVFPALTTKFTPDDTLDLPAFDHNLEAQIEAGVDGIILGGSLGEASTLTHEEKESLVKHAVGKVGGKIPVILNISEASTKDGIKVAESAADLGASGLMLLPPMRYKADDRETVAFFKAIAQSTSLPIMIYNNPVDYKIETTPDMFEELLELDNIQAVKESTREVTNVTRLRNRFGDRLKILCGVDTLAVEELLMGADGWVAGLVCAFPRETVAIYRLIKAGRLEEARQIFRWFLPLLELDLHPKLVQYIKLAEVHTGIGTERVRAPRLPLVGEERNRVEGIIKTGLANRPNLPDYLYL
ncbi:dihydrodipicolinate synthase family protein [Persicitalea jodogahamensis]|uniref:Dihydrodipicolinate synthase family protein n=1 Tax=Persicitalea jodogahamensis TaxID=402147 RepID=A0A8J3D5G6_9BACT|nr:dihydrodipicolinate synthase family protein [Persicitalea jodogahamensis]GHB77826.1 dihydrodipicolinate synthase family protein [Persicitalea jodogahamensis]